MCSCGGADQRKYEVTKKDGSKQVVISLAEAQRIARESGGMIKAA